MRKNMWEGKENKRRMMFFWFSITVIYNRAAVQAHMLYNKPGYDAHACSHSTHRNVQTPTKATIGGM